VRSSWERAWRTVYVDRYDIGEIESSIRLLEDDILYIILQLTKLTNESILLLHITPSLDSPDRSKYPCFSIIICQTSSHQAAFQTCLLSSLLHNRSVCPHTHPRHIATSVLAHHNAKRIDDVIHTPPFPSLWKN